MRRAICGTDLSAPVDAPPAVPPGARTISFADAARTRHLGTALPIAGTPWQVWVEFNEASLMQPADTLLRRMLPWTAGLILFGFVAVGVLSARITTPLEQMADAADAIASGDYSRRVIVTGRDEIGRFGSAFNVMAAYVAESRDVLEARVQARTKELNKARQSWISSLRCLRTCCALRTSRDGLRASTLLGRRCSDGRRQT